MTRSRRFFASSPWIATGRPDLRQFRLYKPRPRKTRSDAAFEQIPRYICGVEVWRGGLGKVYRWPALSSAGASLTRPCFRFIELDVRISRFQLSEKGSRLRPRQAARPLSKADEAQHIV
jgi:hypothetical protein